MARDAGIAFQPFPATAFASRRSPSRKNARGASKRRVATKVHFPSALTRIALRAERTRLLGFPTLRQKLRSQLFSCHRVHERKQPCLLHSPRFSSGRHRVSRERAGTISSDRSRVERKAGRVLPRSR